MFGKEDVGYKPLLSETEARGDLKRHDFLLDRMQRMQTRTIILIFFAFEVVQVLLGSISYVVVQQLSVRSEGLDGLAALARYNVTKVFNNDNKVIEDTPFADLFWMDMAPHSAIMSLNTAEALSLGHPPSVSTPGTPDESLYQMDVFHNIHCLYRIRQQLLANETAPKDHHTLHCLNYIRQSLMCHSDLLLGSTDDYDDYGLADTHTCRDYDAVVKWTEAHKWKGFRDWAKERYGSDLKN